MKDLLQVILLLRRSFRSLSNMIRCHLARLLGERKLKIAEVARDTGVNRGTLTRMYYETAERFDTAVLDVLCAYLSCELGEILEYIPSDASDEVQPIGPRRVG